MIHSNTINLKNIPSLVKQVDQLCNEYTNHPTQDKQDEIRYTIKEFEDFFSRNDEDPRAILIDRLAYQLKAIIQGRQVQSPMTSSSLGPSSPSTPPSGYSDYASTSRMIYSKSDYRPDILTPKRQEPAITEQLLERSDNEPPKHQEESITNSTSCITNLESDLNRLQKEAKNLEPAYAADYVAAMSYASAHSQNDTILSPFHSMREVLLASSSSGQRQSSDHSEDTVLVSFDIRLTDQEYREFVRRKDIHKARVQSSLRSKSLGKSSYNNTIRDPPPLAREERYQESLGQTYLRSPTTR